VLTRISILEEGARVGVEIAAFFELVVGLGTGAGVLVVGDSAGVALRGPTSVQSIAYESVIV
jgi:hypothetical protein